MTIIPPGYADCSYEFRLDGFNRPAYITFGIDALNPEPNALAESVYQAAIQTNSLMTCVSASVRLTTTTVRVGQDGGDPLIGVRASQAIGGLTGAMLPPNCAVLVHKRTARGGRRGRGRFFLPWTIIEGNVGNDGTFGGSASVSNIQNAMNGLLLQLSMLAGPMVILHSSGSSSPGLPDVVTDLVLQTLIATQRRRLGR